MNESNANLISTSKLTLIWITLLLLTLCTALVGYYKLSGIYVVSFILVTVFVKGVLIIDHFMGLKHVKGYWRLAMVGFVTVIPIVIFVGYYFGLASK